MILARRSFLAMGGGLVATLTLPASLCAAEVEVIEMKGTSRGERVWFAPRGVSVKSGTTVRFINHDPGNGHTSTAYHPDIYGRERRIPAAAEPWDSDYLLPDESFEVVLTVPGVYDYYCVPHEMAAMVGRIVVGKPTDAGWEGPSKDMTDITPEVLAALPGVEEILAHGRVEQENGV